MIQIQNGSLSKRSACLKYGINRNTLSLFILKQSAAQIIINDAVDLTLIMNDNQKNTALIRKVKKKCWTWEVKIKGANAWNYDRSGWRRLKY